jgi:hypothetical protein
MISCLSLQNFYLSLNHASALNIAIWMLIVNYIRKISKIYRSTQSLKQHIFRGKIHRVRQKRMFAQLADKSQGIIHFNPLKLPCVLCNPTCNLRIGSFL